jgi:hypothetical protein
MKKKQSQLSEAYREDCVSGGRYSWSRGPLRGTFVGLGCGSSPTSYCMYAGELPDGWV